MSIACHNKPVDRAESEDSMNMRNATFVGVVVAAMVVTWLWTNLCWQWSKPPANSHNFVPCKDYAETNGFAYPAAIWIADHYDCETINNAAILAAHREEIAAEKKRHTLEGLDERVEKLEAKPAYESAPDAPDIQGATVTHVSINVGTFGADHFEVETANGLLAFAPKDGEPIWRVQRDGFRHKVWSGVEIYSYPESQAGYNIEYTRADGEPMSCATAKGTPVYMIDKDGKKEEFRPISELAARKAMDTAPRKATYDDALHGRGDGPDGRSYPHPDGINTITVQEDGSCHSTLIAPCSPSPDIPGSTSTGLTTSVFPGPAAPANPISPILGPHEKEPH